MIYTYKINDHKRSGNVNENVKYEEMIMQNDSNLFYDSVVITEAVVAQRTGTKV